MGIWEIVGIFATLLGVVLGYITWFEKRRDKKERIKEKKRQKEKEEWKKEILDLVTENLDMDIDITADQIKDYAKQKYVTKKQMEKETCDILEAIKRIDDKLETHFLESIQSERERLASEIINYYQDLQSNLNKSAISYQHIHSCYKRYKEIKGNSYIEEVFNEIKKTMRERQEEHENENH